jgi:hypothetical protein
MAPPSALGLAFGNFGFGMDAAMEDAIIASMTSAPASTAPLEPSPSTIASTEALDCQLHVIPLAYDIVHQHNQRVAQGRGGRLVQLCMGTDMNPSATVALLVTGAQQAYQRAVSSVEKYRAETLPRLQQQERAITESWLDGFRAQCTAQRPPAPVFNPNLPANTDLTFVMQGNGHYTLVFIDRLQRQIEFYDSIPESGTTEHRADVQQALENIRDWLEQHDQQRYRIVRPISIRIQPDSYQCGIWDLFILEQRLALGQQVPQETLVGVQIAEQRQIYSARLTEVAAQNRPPVLWALRDLRQLGGDGPCLTPGGAAPSAPSRPSAAQPPAAVSAAPITVNLSAASAPAAAPVGGLALGRLMPYVEEETAGVTAPEAAPVAAPTAVATPEAAPVAAPTPAAAPTTPTASNTTSVPA